MTIVNYPLSYDSKSLKYTPGAKEPSHLEVVLKNIDGVFYPVKLDPSFVDKEDSVLEKEAYKEIQNSLFANSFQKEAIDELKNMADKLKDDFKKELSLIKVSILSTAELPNDIKDQIVKTFPEYEVGKSYRAGDKFMYQSEVYEVIQEHTSQNDWVPSDTKSLYKNIKSLVVNSGDDSEEGEEEVVEIISEFVRPLGAHDAYKKGDKITFEDRVYVSTIDNNVYSPKEYAQGWKEVIA